MKVSNPKAQSSSSIGITTVDSSEATAGITVFASPEPTVNVSVHTTAAPSSVILTAQQGQVLRSAITSLSVQLAQFNTVLTAVETYKLAESRRLSWQEMLKATESSLRQAEDYRRTLRELESVRDSLR